MEDGRRKSKRLSYTAKFKVNLFSAQRIRETAELLQFLELMKQCLTVAETQGSDQQV
jgi:hypothetical protein